MMEKELFNYIAAQIDLNEEEKETFRSFNLFQQHPKGSILLREGAYARESYFVMKGIIRSYFIKNGTEVTTGFYMEEEGFTPESALSGEPSSIFIACEEDCLLVVSTPDMEKVLFEKFPRYRELCLTRTEQELATSKASFAKFLNASPEQRYLELLEKRPELLLRVPQHQIASYLGIKPESLSRIRKRLREAPRSS